MDRLAAVPTILTLGAALALVVPAAADDVAEYAPAPEYPVIEELEARDERLAAEAVAKTEEIIEAYRAEHERPETILRFDMSDIPRPDGPEAFDTRLWHLPPTPQYLTGTCWSFAATSLMESEVHRLTGREIKLSEMWTAYWEFVAKAQGFVRSRGESLVAHGSQSRALLRVLRERGTVPRSAYEGIVGDDPRFDHDPMLARVTAFLEWCRAEGFWDEEAVVAMVRRILDATMGPPPETVTWNGREMSPLDFRDEVCRLDADAYVDVMSTLASPFWSRAELDAPDNWWHDDGYLNVPLDDWYGAILGAVDAGYSLAIGGDTTEPGMNGFEDLAVVADFDLPPDAIDQSAREYRIAAGVTTDDHGVHLVGHTRLDGHDFFLVKDSNRSSRQGAHEGYYFYRGDYVRLKMLTFTVHRDAVPQLLGRAAD